MALFMDIHRIEGGVSAADVAQAHAADLKTQEGHAGVDYQKYMFTTTEFHIRYHTSARYLDELVVKCWAATPHFRLDCYYEIYRKVGNQLLCEAKSSHALVDPKRGLQMGGAMFHDQFEAYLNRQDAAAREAAVR